MMNINDVWLRFKNDIKADVEEFDPTKSVFKIELVGFSVSRKRIGNGWYADIRSRRDRTFKRMFSSETLEEAKKWTENTIMKMLMRHPGLGGGENVKFSETENAWHYVVGRDDDFKVEYLIQTIGRMVYCGRH